jgi:Rrf2 family protein
LLSKRAKYGLKALLRLAAAWQNGPILIADLARSERIPLKFLENILLGLKRAGLLASKKGRGGGYGLAREPRAIMVGEVIRLLDGPLALVPCASLTAYRRCDDCTDESACGIRLLMKDVRDVTAAILDQTSLEDLLSRERRVRSEAAALSDFQI